MTSLPAMPYELNRRTQTIRRRFIDRFDREITFLNGTLYILDERVRPLETKWLGRPSILFLSQNYSLLNSSLQLLASGNELESLMLIRPVAERLILSVYFYEFPEDIEVYLDGHRKFSRHMRKKGYDSYYIEAALRRIMEEGKIFNGVAKDQWIKEMSESLIDEPSNLLHANIFPGLEASLRGKRIIRDSHFRVKGMHIILSKIRQAALWSAVALLETENAIWTTQEINQIRFELKQLYEINAPTANLNTSVL